MRPLRALGHPVHPPLTDLPLGLLPFAFAWDLLAEILGKPGFWEVGGWAAIAGLVCAVPTAVAGFWDFVALPRDRERAANLALWHMTAVLTAVGLFLASVLIRSGPKVPSTPWLPLVLEGSGTVLLLVGGWLGGHLVFHHRVGIDS